MIDTSASASHAEMLAAHQRAFEIMMEGFEQMENIIHAHDQIIDDRQDNALYVQNAQDELIKDRKGDMFTFLILKSEVPNFFQCFVFRGG